MGKNKQKNKKMSFGQMINNDDMNDFKEKNMQPLSNQEASYLLQDSYKKKMEMMEKKKKPIHIPLVYQEFLDYCKKFSQLKFSDDLDTEDIDPLRNKLIKIKKIRKDI